MMRPKRKLRKIVIVASLVVVISVAVFVELIVKPRFGRLTTPVTYFQEIVDENSEHLQTLTDSADSMVAKTVASPIPVEVDESSEFDRDNPAYDEILEQMKLGLKQQNDAFLYLDDRLQPIIELMPKIQKLIENQVETSEQMALRLQELKVTAASISQKIEDKKSPPVVKAIDLRPPFRLIAIDRWNRQWNAVLELDGKITMIGQQDVRSGWRLINIDPRSKSAVFESQNGYEVELYVSG